MSVLIRMICIDAIDSFPCIVVVTENSRILFDVGEGVQRLCVEHGVKLGKVSNIFVTRFSNSTICGIPGLCLTIADAGESPIFIDGPDKLNLFMHSTRNFMRISGGRLHTSDDRGTCQNSYLCDGVIIHALRFSTYSSAFNVCSHVCYVGQTEAQKGKFDLQKATDLRIPKGPLYGKLKNGESVTLTDGTVISPDQVLGPAEASRYFIIVCNMELHEEKLVHDVSENEYFNRFCDNGDFSQFLDCMIHLSPESVVRSLAYQSWMHRFGPAVQHIFTSSACKQSSFVAATQTSRKLHRVCPSLFAEVQPFLSSAVHIGVAGLPLTPVLATPSMEYRVLPTKRRGLALRDSVSNGSPDHAADESWNSLVRNGGGGEALQETDWLKMQTAKAYIDSAKYAHQMQLRSSLPVDSDASLSDLERDSLADLDLFSEGSAALLAGADNRLTFLGTGCAVPSKYRNVSGILLQLAATDSSMLLDAGEGTWAQLLRVGLSRPDQFGISSSSFDNESGLDEFNHDLEALVSLRIAQQLKVVWISHPHADHHLGLLTVIAERKRLIKGQSSPSFAPLVVVAPPSVLLFLEENALLDGELAGAFLPLSTRQLDPQDLCDTSDLYWPEETNGMAAPSDAGETKAWPYRHRRVAESCRAQMVSSLSQTQAVFASMGLRSVLNVQVTHCRQSFGLVLEGGTGVGDAAIFKLVYSGDTRPCNLLTEHGRGATILIHEATFEDDKLHEAVAKRHSTLGEALDVGAAMGAHRVVLTHFSQRYPSMPQIESASTHLDADLQIQPQQQYQRKVSRRGGVNSCNFIVAFDFMHVSFRDLLWAPTVTDVLERVFPPVAIDADEINDVELDEEREVSAGVDTKQKQQSGKKGGREKPPSVTRDCTCCDRNVSDEGSAHIAQMAMECSVHVARAGKRKAEQLNKPPL